MRHRLLLPALLLSAAPAFAHGGGNWVGSIIGLCLAQDASYAKLPTGAHLMQDESMPRFVASLPPDYRQCLQANKAVTARLCKALLSPEPNPGLTNKQYDAMEVTYKKELSAFENMSCGHAPR